jgi:hypothetical protein
MAGKEMISDVGPAERPGTSSRDNEFLLVVAADGWVQGLDDGLEVLCSDYLCIKLTRGLRRNHEYIT